MSKIREFDNEIYPRKLWFVYNDKELVKKSFESVEGDTIDDDAFSGAWATCLPVTKKNDGMKGVIIHFSKQLVDEGGSQIVSTITHESVHTANMIFRDIGVSYTMYADEHFAYLCGWIARKSWQVLQEIIYK